MVHLCRVLYSLNRVSVVGGQDQYSLLSCCLQVFYYFCPGFFEGNCENRIKSSSREAGDLRRSPALRRSCTTYIPSESLNGNSTGISQRRSPGCLFTRPIFSWILDCSYKHYRHDGNEYSRKQRVWRSPVPAVPIDKSATEKGHPLVN